AERRGSLLVELGKTVDGLFGGGDEGEGIGWGHGCILLPMENADSVWRSYIRCALSESCRSTLRHGYSLLQLILAFCPHINDRLKSVGGSFPHLRGTRTDHQWTPDGCRSIPAPAGNTARCTPPTPAVTVHPRTCGEHQPQRPSEYQGAGSSPHLRGTRTRPRRYLRRWPVHPRTCGEHTNPTPNRAIGAGSSPHLRGTRRRPQMPGR